jgi:pSer/pThr/pTyr-binding forkhead associated (FHA) protein/DNA-binding CsgD family transcriptional regulator
MPTVSANPPADAQPITELKDQVDAERTGLPFLLFTDGSGRQQVFLFAPELAQATVGRQTSSDLRLDWDDQVSRLHARFERVEGGWELVDDGMSRNGTFVNAERLSGRCRLNDGDSLRFGTTTATFRSPGQVQLGAADAAKAQAGVALSSTQRRVLAALCRPYKGRSGYASPATDQHVADELFLSVGEVRTHVRVLYAKLGVDGLPQSERRVRLVERAFAAGLISERDL